MDERLKKWDIQGTIKEGDAMPQRNGQNPIKTGGPTGPVGSHHLDGSPLPKSGGGAPHCPACKAEVPAKPGFRLSSLKCPKCGAPMAKK